MPADHPVKKSATEYVTKYEAAHGKGSVSSFGGHAWDAGLLLQNAIPVALKKGQPGTKEFRKALRDAIEATKNLPAAQKYNARVFCYDYKSVAWTGKEYGQQCYFPTWVIPEDSPEVQAAAEVHRGLFGEPRIDKWTFSTNGVATSGRHKIPMIGFGPGKEAQAHAPNELQWKDDLVRCAALYAVLPKIYCEKVGDTKTVVTQL